jgi:putative membrane protein
VRSLTNEKGQALLLAACRSVEARSRAEVVITVRRQSGPYLHADLLAGILAGTAALAFLLFSPWPFAVPWLLVDPILIGGLAAFLSSRWPALRRLLTPRAARRRRVDRTAAALFHEKGVRRTREATGLLVHVSLLERMASVVADDGVVDAVPLEDWRRAVARIDAAVGRAADAATIASAVEALGDVLAPVLERGDDDANELPDEVCAS